jgi:hypothetical protein
MPTRKPVENVDTRHAAPCTTLRLQRERQSENQNFSRALYARDPLRTAAGSTEPYYRDAVRNRYGTPHLSGGTATNNSWNLAVTVSSGDFTSVDESLAMGARQAEGSLPNNSFMRLVVGSDLIDKGVNVGLPWIGSRGVRTVSHLNIRSQDRTPPANHSMLVGCGSGRSTIGPSRDG